MLFTEVNPIMTVGGNLLNEIKPIYFIDYEKDK